MTPKNALARLAKEPLEFVTLFAHGSMELEVYKPEKVDNQHPHDRDEIYVIISGQGEFVHNDDRLTFGPGDFLFVPAGDVHRFENFTEDFATWVIFYGPKGGERPK